MANEIRTAQPVNFLSCHAKPFSGQIQFRKAHDERTTWAGEVYSLHRAYGARSIPDMAVIGDAKG